MLYILSKSGDLWDFILLGLPEKYSVVKVRLNLAFWIRVCRKFLGRRICWFPFLSRYVFQPSVYEGLKAVKPSDTVLLLGEELPSEWWAVAKSLPAGVKLYQWFWNPLHKTYKERVIRSNVSFAKSLGFQVYTFDPDDVAEYDLKYNTQVGRKLQVSSGDSGPNMDFYFMGKVKDREIEIRRLEESLKRRGFQTHFIYVYSSDMRVSYEDNITFLLSCRCIVEILQSSQAGLTMRPLEALFYRKKLLTNNVRIKEYDFYRKENIFIIGVDSWNGLSDFLFSPYVEVPTKIVDRYTIEGWIRVFEDSK